MCRVPLDQEAVECKDKEKTHWVELELLGSGDVPVGYEPFEVKLSDGESTVGVLNANGWIRLGLFVPGGNCTVSFPQLDRRAWSHLDAQPAHAGPFRAGKPRDRRPAGLTVVLQRGECCSSVAEAAGHLWSTVWNDKANETLRRDCDDPNCLITGRGLAIPPLERGEHTLPIDRRHRFRFDNRAKLVIRLTTTDGRARRFAAYQLTIDGTVVQDETTGADGIVSYDRLSPRARQGRLLVRGDGTVPDRRFRFELGTLQAYGEGAGVQQRLRNLGHRATEDGIGDTARARAAVRSVQKAAREAETGTATDIAARLRADHCA